MPGVPDADRGKPAPARASADERVANLFLTLGIPAHIKGYQYLREAVRMVMADHELIGHITGQLYPGVARRYDTSSSKVERAMRHAIDDMAARQQCMDTMRELFRQFMSKLILEKTKQEQNNIYLDSRISFQEIDQYFFSGCACAFFQIAVDTYTDLRYDPSEWQ